MIYICSGNKEASDAIWKTFLGRSTLRLLAIASGQISGNASMLGKTIFTYHHELNKLVCLAGVEVTVSQVCMQFIVSEYTHELEHHCDETPTFLLYV